MASSTQCFLSHPTFTTPTRTTKLSSQRQVVAVNTKPNQLIVCKTQNQKQLIHEDDCSNIISRRLALTVLIGSAAVGSKVSPADAAYGESGILLSWSLYHRHLWKRTYLVSVRHWHDTHTCYTLVTFNYSFFKLLSVLLLLVLVSCPMSVIVTIKLEAKESWFENDSIKYGEIS